MSNALPPEVAENAQRAVLALQNLQAISQVFQEAAAPLPPDMPLRAALLRAAMEISDLGGNVPFALALLSEESSGPQEDVIQSFLDTLKTYNFTALVDTLETLPISHLETLKGLWGNLSNALTHPLMMPETPQPAVAAVEPIATQPILGKSQKPGIILSASEPKLTQEVMRRMPFNLITPIFKHLSQNFLVRGALTSSHLHCLVHAHLLLAGLLEAVMPAEAMDIQAKYIDEVVRHHNMARNFNTMHETQYGAKIFDDNKLKTPNIHAQSPRAESSGQNLVAGS